MDFPKSGLKIPVSAVRFCLSAPVILIAYRSNLSAIFVVGQQTVENISLITLSYFRPLLPKETRYTFNHVIISQSVREQISIMVFEGQFELLQSYHYSGRFNLWVFRALTFCEEFTKAKSVNHVFQNSLPHGGHACS